jgi:predicted MPP superfamily phosphohydrolase
LGLFLFTFFLIYGGTHLYFFLKVRGAFAPGIAYSLLLALFLLVMVLSPVLVRALEKEGLELPARLMAYTGYLWMGFLFLFFSASIALDIYHLLLRAVAFLFHRDLAPFFLSQRVALALPLVWGMAATCYGYFEALDIKTERLVIESPKIPRSVGKLTIVQISDLHLGLIVRQERLERVVAQIRGASPDILVSTGDLVDGEINRLTGLAELLGEIRPRYGKFAVTGNHEIYAGLREALAFTGKAGFRVLRGEGAVAGGVVNIAGVDDPVLRRVSNGPPASEKRLLETLDRGIFTLLLKHRPAVEGASLGLFDLQLSGHVHKGQIFPFNLATHLFYPVKMGFSLQPQGSALYVSRGTGTWGPPIRFLAPPEVTVIELRHSEKGM